MGAEWCSMLAHAVSHHGKIVDFTPLTTNQEDPVLAELPDTLASYVTGLGALLEALAVSGKISGADAQLARERLGSFAVTETVPELRPKAPVILVPGVATELAFAGILMPLTAEANVVINQNEKQGIEQHRLQLDLRDEMVAWLKSLRERVRTGLGTRYVMIPNTRSGAPEGWDAQSNPTLACLWDFLDIGRSKAVLSCIDDRTIGNVDRFGESKVVDTYDLLAHFKARRKITSEQFYSFTHVLRRENYWYIPISKAELRHHLATAEYANDSLIESAELRTIRRYFAACLLDWDSLQKLPPNHPLIHRKSEIAIAASVQVGCTDVLLRIWKDPNISLPRKHSASDWILNSLWIDIAAVNTFGKDETAVVEGTLGICLAHLITNIVQIGILADQTETRTAYLDWLLSRINADSDKGGPLAVQLKRMLETLNSDIGGVFKKPWRRMMSNVVTALPVELRIALDLTSKERKAFGYSEYTAITVGEFTFDGVDIWPAIAKAAEGKAATVESKDTHSKQFSLKASWKENQLRVLFDDGEKKFGVSNELFALVSNDPKVQRRTLEDLRSSFDLSKARSKTAFAKVLSNRRVDLRLRDTTDLRDNSFEWTLKATAQKIRQIESIDLNDFVPINAIGVLQHLRLEMKPRGQKYEETLARSASVLLAEEGFEEAFYRHACLPVMLASEIVESFDRLPVEARERFIALIDAGEGGAIQRLHACFLIWRSESGDQAKALEWFKALNTKPGTQSWGLFASIMHWSYSRLTLEAGDSAGDETAVLATWIHAGRLSQLFCHGTDKKGLSTFFKAHGSKNPERAFTKQEQAATDVSNPRNLDFIRLVIHGLSATLKLCRRTPDLSSFSAELNSLCFPYDDQNFPALSLVAQQNTRSNFLGAFVGPCDPTPLVEYVGERINQIAPTALHIDSLRAFDLLNEDTTNQSAWALVGLHIVGSAPTAEEGRRLLHAVEAVNFATWADLDQAKLTLGFIFAQAVNFPHRSQLFEAKLVELSKALGSGWLSMSAEDSADLIANTAFHMCFSASAPTERMRRFLGLCAQAAHALPEAAPRLLEVGTRLAFSQRCEHLPWMVRSLLQLRCAA